MRHKGIIEPIEIKSTVSGKKLSVDEIPGDLLAFDNYNMNFLNCSIYPFKDKLHIDEVVKIDFGVKSNEVIYLWKENIDGKEMTAAEVIYNGSYCNDDSYDASCIFYFLGNDLVKAKGVVLFANDNIENTGGYTISLSDAWLTCKYYDVNKISEMMKCYPCYQNVLGRAGIIENILDKNSELASNCSPSEGELVEEDADNLDGLDVILYIKSILEHPSFFANFVFYKVYKKTRKDDRLHF